MISLIFPKALLQSLYTARGSGRYLALLATFSLLAGLPGYADPVLDKAQQLLKTGRAESATAIYTQYLQLHPTSLPAELALANIAMRRFEYTKARSILEKALAQHPDSAVTAATIGRLFQLWSNSPAGKVSDNSRDYLALAQEHFRQAITLGPDDPLVLTYVAEWQLQQDDMVSAERDLHKALKIRPTFVPAFQGLTRFYMKARDIPRARDTILHAMELDSLDQMNYFLTAQLLGMVNRPAEAVKYAEKSEQLDFGRLPERDYFLASQYEKLGEAAKATQYYENLTVYTPREPQVWLKLGDLYDSLNRTEQSMSAYRNALALDPDILTGLYAQARDNTRAEKISQATSQWIRLIALRPDDLDTILEASGAIAGLHYVSYFYHPDQPILNAGKAAELLDRLQAKYPSQASLQVDNAKMDIALQGGVNDATRQTLIALSQHSDSALAGEAAFLLDDLAQTNARLEEVDGLSDEAYIRLADRLLLDQELVFSKVFYQRAYQAAPTASLEAAMKRIQAKQNLASQRVNEGNAAFNEKDYKAALAKYQEAARIYRQWDTVYLRLGDTYEHLKQWKAAKQAYDTAIALSPGLMDSEGFSKNYHKLRKKVASK